MNFKQKKWQWVRVSRALVCKVPNTSGVYAIGRAKREYGLLFEWELLYVGKAKNIQKRFCEHLNPAMEHNEGLRNALSSPSQLEFWYVLLDFEHISDLEKELIRRCNPTLNQIKYKES